ncbi:hypothetical protein ZYGM_004433 [Zygosaccharomyces mellis]|uniref:Uncharacterized protein n=1 Tax=Zygosaccharomyces mellis TaxID=42258 RepID=A0A4C2DZS2_9SACH|nr:hypothetical protein ZYGM_004433 [Zygosaccharomyces mellis]
MPTDPDESFANWLASRRIVSRQHRPYLCFDSRVLAAKGSAVLGGRFKVKHYLYDQQLNRGEFSNKAIEGIEDHLCKLEKYSLIKNEGCEFVNSIKEGCDQFEPIWSDPLYLNPAEKLVPPNQKLLADVYFPKAERAFANPFAHQSLSFKNNLACIYGKLLFMAHQGTIEIHNLDCLFLEKFHWKEMSFFIHLKYCKNFAKFAADGEMNKENIDFLFMENNFHVNYLKVSRFFGNDVLCLCLDGGLVLVYELYTIVAAIKESVKKKELQRRKHINIIPLLILRVPESCWSVDILDEGPVTYLAAGHNGPGITIFAFDKNHSSLQPVDSYELSSFHNVPNLTFIPGSHDKNGFITLAFCSIYGNVTTVRLGLKQFDKKIQVRIMDSQFFAAFCWTVTPLKKKDFLQVPKFELLNLNYQTSFKRSILYSVTQDSLILDCHPSSAYCSGELGIGALTTQIPVPVAPLEWGCQNGITNSNLQLRFTSFDKKGAVTKAQLNSENAEFVVPGYGPLFRVTRDSEQNLGERVIKDSPEDNYRHFYMFGERGCLQNEHLSDDAFKRYDNFIFKNFNSHENDNSHGVYYHVWSDLDDDSGSQEPFDPHSLRENYGTHTHLNDKVTVYCPIPLTRYNPTSFPDICGFTLAQAFADPMDRLVEDRPPTSDERNSQFYDHLFPVDGLLAAGHLDEQPKWALHNHARKVRHLLNMVESNSKGSPFGYRLSELDEDFLFVTSAHHIYLIKSHPLIVTSFTKDRIFPVNRITLCSRHEFLMALDRINFVCHIKELNCIVVASQVGLLSLLRLTEYNGIYSFRQEYILGWNPQMPGDQNAQCILTYTNPDGLGNSCPYCGIDDVVLPFYNIVGLDYSYVPEDKLNCRGAYAILYVLSGNSLRRIKIYPGSHTN